MKRRQYTREEINAQFKRIARETRMAERTPWTAMGIMCGYTLLRSEGFHAQRIVRITQTVDQYEEKYHAGTLTVEEMSKRLMDKAEWSIEHVDYTDADITHRKGSYDWYLDHAQIYAQNTINAQATRYMIFVFNALMDEYGYGKQRLTRVQEYINNLLERYQKDKTSVAEWQHALLDEAGIAYEMPVDPLTQTRGSVMTGFGGGNGF